LFPVLIRFLSPPFPPSIPPTTASACSHSLSAPARSCAPLPFLPLPSLRPPSLPPPLSSVRLRVCVCVCTRAHTRVCKEDHH
jgi:hypothetical protein